MHISLWTIPCRIWTTGTHHVSGSTAYQDVSRNTLEALVVDEISRQNTSVRNMVFLDLASLSFRGNRAESDLTGARFYLDQVLNSKIPVRQYPLRVLDFLYRHWERLCRKAVSFFHYLQKLIRFKPEQAAEVAEPVDTALLDEAVDKSSQGQMTQAVELYRQYLRLYPHANDRGFVTIALSQLLIRQRQYPEARRLLEEIQWQFAGGEEAGIAMRLLKKIEILIRRESEIDALRETLMRQKGSVQWETAGLRLALFYLSTYRYQEAEELLKQFEESRDAQIRSKVKFYLSWVYKSKAQYDIGIQVLNELLMDPEIEQELVLGLRVELADIYYRKQDIQNAIKQYEFLKADVKKTVFSQQAAGQVWQALAELEMASIYYYDLYDPEHAKEHLARFKELTSEDAVTGSFEAVLEEAGHITAKERAFLALRNFKIRLAIEFFKKILRSGQGDAQSYAGLATAYAFQGDLTRAMELAQKAYALKGDAYTRSVLGYLYALGENHEAASRFYEEALRQEPGYIPARYNLAYEYLKTGRHEEAVNFLVGLDVTFQGYRNVMHAKILNNMGCAYWFLGDSGRAQNRFRQALDLIPFFKDSQLNLKELSQWQDQPVSDLSPNTGVN